jgi:hypothetical protein
MKQFIVKYRSPHHSEPYELIFASDKAHAIGIGQERYGSKLVCVEYAVVLPRTCGHRPKDL